ncbi:AmpE protein [Klebsiella pneumoniae]|uniref:AmpE protein n=1 Tax=Klebsiella pneumoniae TaxID=573 RepID=A0A378BEL5_KLEPN|nr:AmpE protein [Klebsiella pneumoniae]
MASELTLIHGVPPGCDEREYLSELQNALLWINYRYYLAPLFWFVVGGAWGPLTLIAYSVLRAWQTWLARYQTPHHRLQSGIDGILHIVDWLPVRLVGWSMPWWAMVKKRSRRGLLRWATAIRRSIRC